MKKSASFSPNRMYRYTLLRSWNPELGCVMFVGLNPSTADETIDDPTVRRCMGFVKSWGYGTLFMANLFAYRTTDPKDLYKIKVRPVGVRTDYFLLKMAKAARIVVAAWGTNGTFLRRDEEVVALIPDLYVLRLTKDGYPSHPLYLPRTLKPVKWVARTKRGEG